MPERGTLYGIGVGPGDPGLLTLKALEILKSVQVVFAAGSTKNSYSLALNVVDKHLDASTEIIRLDFPMTQDQDQLARAWEDNARRVLAALDSGRDAAFVTIGDPLTYSTYGYLLTTLLRLAPGLPVRTIPGVTAYQAAAARLNLPLVESKQSLVVVSGVSEPGDIPRLARSADTLVIMKTYRNYDRIMDALECLPNRWRTYLVSSCGLPGECIHEDASSARGRKMPYLSLVIAKRGGEED